MNNTSKIVISALLAAFVISLLWLVIPVTPVWIISYIAAIVAVIGITTSFFAYRKKAAQLPQGHVFPVTAGTYAVISALLSIIMIIFDYNRISIDPAWYAITHTTIFIFFVIRSIILLAGSEYINKLNETAGHKHSDFNKEKANYWKRTTEQEET